MQLQPMQIYAIEFVEEYLFCYLMVQSDNRPNLAHQCVQVGSGIRKCTHTYTAASPSRKFKRYVCKANLIYKLHFQNILIPALKLILFFRMNFKIITILTDQMGVCGFWTLFFGEISPCSFFLSRYLKMCFLAVRCILYAPQF